MLRQEVTVSRRAYPAAGGVIHVIHASRSRPGEFVMLCSKKFDRIMEIQGTRRDGDDECAKCAALDDPFSIHKVPRNPAEWAATVAANVPYKASPNARTALINRDLITAAGIVTPRGEVLVRDLTRPTPWVDLQGVVHARNPLARVRGLCGTSELIVEAMSYEKLRRIQQAYETVDVTCMACISAVTPCG